MDRETIKSLNSPYVKLYEEQNKLMVSIDMQDIMSGKVLLKVPEVLESELLLEISPTSEPTLKLFITPEIKEVYKNASMDNHKLHDDVYDYLEIAAQSWSSSNKSASAITGGLIGKISKSFSNLNETLFRIVGGEKRDAYLKELIKSNMPMMKYFWDSKS